MTTATLKKQSWLAFTPEQIFVCAGLGIVGALYHKHLLALDPAKWATVSAWIMLFVGVRIGQQLEQRFVEMFRRLRKRGAVSLDDSAFEEYLARLQSRAGAAAAIGGAILPSFLCFAYLFVFAGDEWAAMSTIARRLLLCEICLEAICALIVGRYVGRGICYGLLGKQMASDGVDLKLILGHSDKAAGLRPIGDFYFFQALVTALPVFFFTFWVLMMPVWASIWPTADASFGLRWKNTYLLFFFVALGVEVLAFAFPLWFFHKQMESQKGKLIPLADEMSSKLCQIQIDRTINVDEAADSPDPAKLVEKIELIESLPTWPLAPDIRSRFAWGNLAFLAPPAAKMSQTVLDSFSTTLK